MCTDSTMEFTPRKNCVSLLRTILSGITYQHNYVV